jgi:anti-sigma B factor antagonist
MFEARYDDASEIVLVGRFDAAQVDKAREFFEKVTTSATVNFRELEYISSAGIGILLSVQNRLKQKGAAIRLKEMNKHIRDVFRYAGFDKIFQID